MPQQLYDICALSAAIKWAEAILNAKKNNILKNEIKLITVACVCCTVAIKSEFLNGKNNISARRVKSGLKKWKYAKWKLVPSIWCEEFLLFALTQREKTDNKI